eukprot:1454125-Prymnesium_polylepis.1
MGDAWASRDGKCVRMSPSTHPSMRSRRRPCAAEGPRSGASHSFIAYLRWGGGWGVHAVLCFWIGGGTRGPV